jgi:hypothetical protein
LTSNYFSLKFINNLPFSLINSFFKIGLKKLGNFSSQFSIKRIFPYKITSIINLLTSSLTIFVVMKLALFEYNYFIQFAAYIWGSIIIG